ncbi:Hypothetical protein; putative exported protein [Herminiimonas arsenicoxydans]|uniref:Secreted protein n=1 Tax=Herminiimonas arsenicoxydans TaxID=204773 RepID=A4G9G3_HERAR|nr:Hypothetical protein; putative exported protein [Herminiimonas arsenicoxydans]
MVNKVAILLFSLLSSASYGQTVTTADRAGIQVVIGRDESGFSSCGIRTMPMMSSVDGVEVYDFSIVIYRERFMPLIKAGRFKLTNKDAQNNIAPKVVTPAPIKFWVANATEGTPLMATNLIPAETSGFVLGFGDLAASWAAILSIANGDLTHVVIRGKSDEYDHVIAFKAKLQPQDFASLSACLDSLLSELRRDAAATKDEQQ